MKRKNLKYTQYFHDEKGTKNIAIDVPLTASHSNTIYLWEK